MPLYLDIHQCDGATAEDIATAHLADLKVQDQYAVNYRKYWFNQQCGKLFCLVEAPSAEAAHCVHQQAHGLVAEKMIEVDPDLLDGFLGSDAPNGAGAALMPDQPARLDPGVRTVMFTDIVGSTEITSLHGDDAGMELLSTHDRVVREALEAHRGGEIKHTGDGIMAVFVSAVCAVRSACQIQAELGRHNATGPAFPVTVRVGIASGEPIDQADDLFGQTVQLAARLCSRAEPGQILVSNVVADLCIGKNLRFSDAGEFELKGIRGRVPTRAVEIAC
ncbi:nickel-binding protein [Sphingomonas xanthus]|nr:nickel-binding protein [Sphingomonas xanthus]